MKKQLILMMTVLTFAMTSCDIDQTQEAKLPDVDMAVDVEAGQMPEFDVDWADVNVGTRTETVKVPKVVVVMEETEVEVPYVDVDMPDAGDREERTLIAEAEVKGEAHKIDIKEVYATGKRLYVISELTPTGEDLGKETMRVSDRLVMNAPEDLDVKHYIIGEKQNNNFNNQYNYIASRNAIAAKLDNGKQIYKK